MRDLEHDLRADGAAWREQVDGLRPDPAPRRALHRGWLGGLVAAALVLGLAVVVLALRHSDPSGRHTVAGADRGAPTQAVTTGASPVRSPALVRQHAICPTGHGRSSSGSGFNLSLTHTSGAPTIRAAAAGFAPRHVRWTIAEQDANSALLLYRAHYLHLVRLPGGGWAVDSGGECGNTDATVPK